MEASKGGNEVGYVFTIDRIKSFSSLVSPSHKFTSTADTDESRPTRNEDRGITAWIKMKRLGSKREEQGKEDQSVLAERTRPQKSRRTPLPASLDPI